MKIYNIINIPKGLSQEIECDCREEYNSGYTAGFEEGYNKGNEDLIANLQNDYFIIPEGTTKIRSHAFYGSSLSSITIPSSVTAIHSYAFEGCRNLTEIVIPDTVEYIGPTSVFGNCVQLTAATLPSGLTVIENNLFMNDGLTGITLPAGITHINSGAFFNCKLTGITLPTGLTFIAQSAFEYCRFTGDIVIPSGVTDIRAKAFANCSGITSMTFESPVPANIITNTDFNASLGRGSYTWPIYVPCEAVDTYKTAWPYYAHRIMCSGTPLSVSGDITNKFV